MTEYVSVFVQGFVVFMFLAFSFMAGYGDGITDSGINKPGFHEGDSGDDWHFWSRAQTLFSVGAGTAFVGVIAFLELPHAISYTVMSPIGFFLAFRTAVYENGKYWWYKSRRGPKEALARTFIALVTWGKGPWDKEEVH